jgi:hydrogenase maturation protease
MDDNLMVIGVGRNDQGEDVVGLLVAHSVRRQCEGRAEVRECDGAPSTLLAQWQDADDVIVVDAVPGGRPGAVHRYEADRDTVPEELLDGRADPSLGSGVREASRCGPLPQRLRVFAIEADQFDRRAGISPEVVTAARRVASEICDEVERRRAQHRQTA